ncbi:MAG TPA: RMD1 family protein [Geobacteraceae bacterium]
MTNYSFAALALSSELDLTRLAASLGVPRKYRWEEPLLLDPVSFRSADTPQEHRQSVYLYYFGCVVFVNCDQATVDRFFKHLRELGDEYRACRSLKFREEYALRVEAEEASAISNDCAIMPRADRAYIDIICFALAKSVALERIEEQVDAVLDEVENLIARLNRGKLNIADRHLASLAASILNFKYTSIAHIMVLDKPEITWDNPEADQLYLTMDNLFELGQRYQEIKHKSEILLDVTEVFTGLSHARRSARLEWIIIVLILIEIVIYLADIFWKKL